MPLAAFCVPTLGELHDVHTIQDNSRRLQAMSRLTDKVGRVCKFDKVRDFQEVEDGIVISLSDALKTGVVQGC